MLVKKRNRLFGRRKEKKSSGYIQAVGRMVYNIACNDAVA